MTYVSKPIGPRLGLFADKIEMKRDQLGHDAKGFKVARTANAINEGTETDDSPPINDTASPPIGNPD